MKFLSELKRRNRILYIFGWLCWLGAFVCIVLSGRDDTQILNINAWIKPLKFFLSDCYFFLDDGLASLLSRCAA